MCSRFLFGDLIRSFFLYKVILFTPRAVIIGDGNESVLELSETHHVHEGSFFTFKRKFQVLAVALMYEGIFLPCTFY